MEALAAGFLIWWNCKYIYKYICILNIDLSHTNKLKTAHFQCDSRFKFCWSLIHRPLPRWSPPTRVFLSKPQATLPLLQTSTSTRPHPTSAARPVARFAYTLLSPPLSVHPPLLSRPVTSRLYLKWWGEMSPRLSLIDSSSAARATLTCLFGPLFSVSFALF